MSFQIILIFHLLLALGLVVLVLIQHGKGADAGAAFGAGSAGSVFGARGANSFIYKITAVVAIGFFLTSVTLAYLATSEADPQSKNTSIMEQSVVVPKVNSDIPTINQDTSEVPNN